MSSGHPPRQADPVGNVLNAYFVYLALTMGVGLIVMILVTLSGMGKPTTANSATAQEADPFDEARLTLEHDADVGACRAALQQVNLAQGSRPDAPRPPAVDAAEQKRLQLTLGLAKEDLSEVAAESYTSLDGWHLAGAFLFRDAAVHALEPEEVGIALPAPTPLERATAAFAWAVREVRLAQPTPVGLTPPQFAVRRGSGTPLERALVFLDLLDQLSAAGDARIDHPQGGDWPPTLQGCLVFCQGHEAPADPWACGVLIEGKPDVYLFDPRLGMPLPGEGGKGVATLTQICRNPDLLTQLKIDGAPAYDVTAEQARTAELHLVCSMSAAAPRMAVLQDRVLPPLRVSLAHDPDRDLERVRAAVGKGEGLQPPVRIWSEGAALLRRFLPPEEGGTDTGRPGGFPLASLVGFTDPDDPSRVLMLRMQLFRLQLAPWDVMPPQFHDLAKFPYNVGLGARVRDSFLLPFARIALEPKGPRDQLLRGDFDAAASDLVGFTARMELEQKRRADAGTDGALEKQVDDWVEHKAIHAYADQLRAQEKGTPAERQAADQAVEAVWKDSGPVAILLEGASSVPGLAEVAYQLGLCKHEKAEQAQTRLGLLARREGQPISPLDMQETRTAWLDALGWWKKYSDAHPEESPDRPSSCPGRAEAVRQMRARAQAMLGDWQAAAATYEDPTDPPAYPLERLAAAYKARRLRKEQGAEKP